MANAFDQFDAAPSAAPAATPLAAPANPFDQFDGAPSPAAAPRAAPQAPWTLQSAVLPWLNGAARTFANNVPLVGDLADKLDARTDALVHSSSYDQALAAQKGKDQAFADQNPVTAGAAGFAGAAGGTVAMLPEWGLGAVGGLGSRVVGSTVGGTTLGTADAMVRGEDPAMGAASGAIGGALGPVIGKGVGAAVRGASGLIQGAPAGLPDTGRIAGSWLQDGFKGMSAEDIGAARQAAGPGAMVMQMSPALQDYAGSIADNNGAGKSVVRGALDAQFAGRDARVNSLVDTNLGPTPNPTEMQNGWEDQVRANASARDAILADAPPVDASQAVRNLSAAQDRFAPTTPEQGALGRALGWMSEERNPTAVSTWERDPVGSGITPEMPANLPEAPPYSDTPSPQRPGPVGMQRPQDLQAFVRSLGGIQDRGGDLAAMGYDNLVARPGQGLGADAMRQAAAQMGYLNHTVDGTANGATRFSTVNDLLDALGSDNPIYSAHDEDAVHAWTARDAAMQDWQQRGGGDPTARPSGPLQGAPGLPFSGDPGYDPHATPVRVPLSDATQLHNVKTTLGNNVTFNKGVFADPNTSIGSAEGPYKRAYGDINEALRGQVEGYAANQDATSSLSAQQKALELGQADLAPNSDPARYPPTFAKTWGELPFGAPEGSLPDIQAARQAGMRFALAAALGNKENDFLAARQALQGSEGWNAANLRTAFGQAPVDNVAQGLEQEANLAASRQRIAGGSPTGEKVQRSRLTQPGGQSEGMLGLAKDWWNDLYIDKPSTYLPFGKIGGRIMDGAYQRARTEMAPHLVKSGPEADALLDAVIAQRQRQAAIAPPAAVDPLTRALVMGAGQYLRQ